MIQKILCRLHFCRNWMYCYDTVLQFHDFNRIPFSNLRRCQNCGRLEQHPGSEDDNT
jgi:hypothetical protein